MNKDSKLIAVRRKKKAMELLGKFDINVISHAIK